MLSLERMRIAISHNRTKQEAVKIVDAALGQMLNPDLPTPMRIENLKQEWKGDKLEFSLTAKMGFMGVPISGDIEVTDRDYIINAELPNLLTRFIPENSIKAGIESRVKGLLGPKTS